MTKDVWIPIIDKAKCAGCGDCVTACPTDALALAENIAVVGNPEACNYCGICEMICPTEAIALPYELSLGSNG